MSGDDVFFTQVHERTKTMTFVPNGNQPIHSIPIGDGSEIPHPKGEESVPHPESWAAKTGSRKGSELPAGDAGAVLFPQPKQGRNTTHSAGG